MSAIMVETTNQRKQTAKQWNERAVWEQQDLVDNAIHRLIEELTGTKRNWDMQIIGAVRDAVAETLEFHGLVNAAELYPFVEEDEPDAENAEANGDRRPTSLSEGIAEMFKEFASAPFLSLLKFSVVVVIFLLIFYGFPMLIGA